MAELLLGGAAAAAGAGTAATAVTGLSTILSVLQGVAAVTGVIGSLSAANANAQVAEANAVQSDLQAGQSDVESAQRQTQMKRELAKVLGENQVAFAAGGVDLTGGVAAQDAADQIKQTGQQLTIDRQQNEMQRALLKMRAAGYRSQADSERTAGLLGAIGKVADFGIDLAKRG